jgi:hypothetical protein
LDVKGVIAYETSRNRSQSGWDKLHGLAIAAPPSFPSFERFCLTKLCRGYIGYLR